MTAPYANISSSKAVRLVARREIVTRVRSKAFVIGTIIGLAMVIVTSIVIQVIAKDGPSKVAVVEQPGVSTAVQSVAASVGHDVDLLPVASRQQGREQVEDGDIDALVSLDGDRLRVVVHEELDKELERVLVFVAQRATLDKQLVQLGGDPVTVNAAVAAAGVDVEKLDPPHDYDGERLVLGGVTGVIIYLALLITGQMVAQGVVEEKASRIVEVLLSTIRSSELITGKVLGIGIVGLLQVVVIGGGGALVAVITGALTISVSAAGSAVIWLVVWFLLGYALYALAFAASAALVSRQEDVGGVITPVMSFLILGYIIGISVLPGDPSNKLCEVLSIIPLFAPTLMPMRLAMGGVPAWQAVTSVGLALVTIPLLVWVSAGIYHRAITRTGARVKLREVLSRG